MSQQHSEPSSTRTSAASANGWLVTILAVMAAVLLYRTVMDSLANRPNYTPRIVAPRGDLALDEKATISIFQAASPSVAYVRTNLKQPTSGEVRELEVSSGTGIVWDENGLIVTNLHVVEKTVFEGVGKLEVQLSGGHLFDAEFVGAVAKHDIAVLRIRATPADLDPITLGTSDDLNVGQKVFAIGNPFGFDRTLSTGVIGGLNRTVGGQAETILAGMIQTDAAINPGNSGGPLLDSAGRLIGVNTAIVSAGGDSAGLGFAVAVNDVVKAVKSIMDASLNDKTPSLGVSILDAETAMENGIPENLLTGGLIVLNVYPATPAAGAGILGCRRRGFQVFLGDQIVAIDGTTVQTLDELRNILSTKKAGDTVTLKTVRGNQVLNIPVTLGNRQVLL
ncbi:MAG: trypsin-like peptidase domain-containing protein [Planctomycetia bacterium]